ncbi:MAG: prepilin peptidase [Planctomycetales bacterium]|nr:prepilin peptidase [Planctomycetales bacterium]
MLPIPLLLLSLFVLGVVLGAVVNWAAYTLAWTPRAISPWARPADQAPPRRWSDRTPLWGWWGLRRESHLHGRAFWLRPILVEASMGGAVAWLGWWEIVHRGLTSQQWLALTNLGVTPPGIEAPYWTGWATFGVHTVLLCFMVAASLIDIDEKIIPDAITVPGTLLGLILAAVLPMGLLPHCDVRLQEPIAGVEASGGNFARAGIGAYVEPVAAGSPNETSADLAGAPHWKGLLIGWGCFALWCVALTPRIWRGRRGWGKALSVLAARVMREVARPPLLWIEVLGAIGIAAVWWVGGAAWCGLLTSLIGMVGAGAIVWAVRIFGSAALQREAMGFGDVTLMMMVGSYLGWQAGVMAFFIAPFAGLVGGVAQLIFRRDDMIPYGPFLCLASAAVAVGWGEIWNAESVQVNFSVPWLVPAALGVCLTLLYPFLLVWRQIKNLRGGSDE